MVILDSNYSKREEHSTDLGCQIQQINNNKKVGSPLKIEFQINSGYCFRIGYPNIEDQ